MKKLILLLLTFPILLAYSQNNNGTIDDVNEMFTKETVYVKTNDGINLATDVYLPVMQDCVTTDITLGPNTYTIQLIPKGNQYVIYDTTNITKENYKLPIIYTRTPYNKVGENNGNNLFPLLGYCYMMQDMRGRYESEGVYFPMFSDAWNKYDYYPNNPIPMDLFPTSSLSNALHHSDGSESVYYINDTLKRSFDIDFDGIDEVFNYSNGDIGMFGASALGNSQYQAVSDIPFTQNNPVKCLMPIVASNEHYNTTLFHNGVYRNSLASGWIRGQMYSGINDSLNPYDPSLSNNIHSSTDYNYTDKAILSEDLLDWFVQNPINGNPSGAYPNSPNRIILDASTAPLNASAQNDLMGSVSRYKNLNTNIYHLTGWWDIFINGQIETFNRTRDNNPSTLQKLIIGPWTHQTIGADSVGDVVYPSNVLDVIGVNIADFGDDYLNDSTFFNKLYDSEAFNWFRANLGGEPYFIIPESNDWQPLGTNQVRVPSENYIIPYYQFLNFVGGQSPLSNVPVEIDDGSSINQIYYNIPQQSGGIINLTAPLSPANINFNNKKDIRVYISGPTNDAQNPNFGNYWVGLDSLPFKNGIKPTKYYLHQNNTLDSIAPTTNEGDLFYTNDPNNPVITTGGNNMIVQTPQNTGDSQGSMDYTNPNYAPLTMNRADVLTFESSVLADTTTILGFPRATIYAKANSSITQTSQTDFDVFVRVLDVYPDGREMFITEGAVNAKSRNYAESIFNGVEDKNALFANAVNNQYYHLKFELLPIGHVFGKNHKIKVLISSSNYPKYQSNPQVPNEPNEFFRWEPGDTTRYNFQGDLLPASTSLITLNFNQNQPNCLELPVLESLPTAIEDLNEQNLGMELYPNPTNDKLTIQLTKPISSPIQIYNLNGQLVFSESIKNTNKKILDIGFLAPGLYVVKITSLSPKGHLLIKK